VTKEAGKLETDANTWDRRAGKAVTFGEAEDSNLAEADESLPVDLLTAR